jgi:dTDP-glucose pyrophosphorylase
MDANKYKVLIPTAGVGSRLGNHCDHVNKTLVPVANRPIISYIIEKFPKDIEIIIDLGHKGELVKEFLTLAYPDRNFTFVWAKRKGLTADLCNYKDILQCPFIFFTNDAIVTEDVPPPDCDWIGYADIRAGNDYRSVVVDSWDNTIIKNIGEKGDHTEAKAYVGVCGINDYRTFWIAMDQALEEGTINQGESFALALMIKNQPVHGIKFTWYDTGTVEALNCANKIFSKEDDPNILPKTQEHIWFCNNRVIKFSTDKKFIAQRVQRAKLSLNGYIPQIENSTQNMYCYRKVNGKVLSDTITLSRFKDFLEWLEGLWEDRQLLTVEVREIYRKFYQDKTFRRVREYFERFCRRDSSQCINSVVVPPIKELLNSVNWKWISEGIPVRFHGDLHFENTIDTGNDFKLLDWRQNFGGLIGYGDIYYDLAKLRHGLIVAHGIIRNGLYKANVDGNIVNFDLLRRQTLIDCEAWFRKYLIKNHYDFHKVEVLTALIYLNIAVLHHQPYADMLFHLGKLMLMNLLEVNNEAKI